MDTQGGIRLIVILAQRETAELVSQGHLRWPPSVGQDWGAIRKTDPRKTKSFWCPDYIAATDSPHHTPLLERLEKCIGLGGDPVSVRLWYILLI